jgi:FAD/FMN-containing dehydrogenase
MADHTQRRSEPGPATVRPDDPRYGDLVGRGSKRFAGKPDYVRVVSSTEQVLEAVQDAVRERLRVAVRSGGHCLEAFVAIRRCGWSSTPR